MKSYDVYAHYTAVKFLGTCNANNAFEAEQKMNKCADDLIWLCDNCRKSDLCYLFKSKIKAQPASIVRAINCNYPRRKD